jgi:hypothetical protein
MCSILNRVTVARWGRSLYSRYGIVAISAARTMFWIKSPHLARYSVG